MINVNWTILISIVNLIVLIYILNPVVDKPIRGILEQSKAQFDGLKNNIHAPNNDIETQTDLAAVKATIAKLENAIHAFAGAITHKISGGALA